MRAVLYGLLLASLNAYVLLSDGHDHHGTGETVANGTTTEAPTEEPTKPMPVCNTVNRTEEDLKAQLNILETCHKPDMSNNLRPLIDDDMSNATNGRLEAIKTCFATYVNNVSDCYSDTLKLWNKTLNMLDEVEDYLCEGPYCKKLQAFYRGAASGCSNTTDATSCGHNTMTTLLFHSSFKEVVQRLVILDYTEKHCKEEATIGTCVVDKLKTCQSDESIGDIAEGLQKRIMDATCGVSCLLHSSVLVWLFLAALFSAQRLTLP